MTSVTLDDMDVSLDVLTRLARSLGVSLVDLVR
jgi:hypothetical protein